MTTSNPKVELKTNVLSGTVAIVPRCPKEQRTEEELFWLGQLDDDEAGQLTH